MSTARSHAMSLQLARETRERFISATVQVVEPLAQAIQDKLSAAASQMGNARDMQDWRDDFLAFQAQGGRWVAATQAAWRKALGAATAGTSSNSLSRLELMGDDVVETNILSSRLAQAVQGKSNFEFTTFGCASSISRAPANSTPVTPSSPRRWPGCWSSNGSQRG